MWPLNPPSTWVGRQWELASLQARVDSVSRGQGSVTWVEGEPGIGKSALVAKGVQAAREAGWNVFWGAADQLSQRLPLRVVLDCLDIRHESADRRRAAIADYLQDHRPGPLAADDVIYTVAEMVLAHVDELCAASPTVIVIDDLHWADDASLTVWHRLMLAVHQLPLLLVGTCHRLPSRPSLQTLRATAQRRGATVLSLGPLSETEAEALVTGIVGVAPRGSMLALVTSAMGNPLYLRELIEALDRDGILAGGSTRTDDSAKPSSTVPPSFVAVLSDRLSLLPTATLETLRAATLLGREFAVSDLAVLLRRPAFDLAVALQDAMAAGIIAEANARLAFRHPLVREVLYESMSRSMRAALHRDAAQTLAATGAEPVVVAQQLLAAGRPGDRWIRRWLIDAAPALVARAPELAVELLEIELDEAQTHDREWALLALALTRVLLNLGRTGDGVRRARQALVVDLEPASRAEIHWLLARSLFSSGSNGEAVETVERALRRPEVPGAWRARLLASLAMFQRASAGDLEAADATALQALAAGQEAEDTFAIAYALTSMWLTNSVRRDHLSALDCVDQALAALGQGPDHNDLRTFILDGRVFTMQNLDRWPEAEATLREGRRLAQRDTLHGTTPSVTAAVLMYWLGRWDDALAELGPATEDLVEVTYSGLRERGPVLLWHGVGALIAGRRDDRRSAAHFMAVGGNLPVMSAADRENSDFLIMARALAAEQDGDPFRALSILSTLLERQAGEMTLVHQWLPDIVRLALAVGDQQAALVALRTGRDEAAAETMPARAAAANSRCEGLFNRDPAASRQAVMHYSAVGPAVDLAGALEDLAVVLADQGRPDEARETFNEAVDRYDSFGAAWDIGRAERRLRALGVRRGVHGPRPARTVLGWEALTPTELKIAGQVAQGQSTSRIAQNMFLSRRTVQTHISHILNKLGVHSRVDIAREAFRHGTTGLSRTAH